MFKIEDANLGRKFLHNRNLNEVIEKIEGRNYFKYVGSIIPGDKGEELLHFQYMCGKNLGISGSIIVSDHFDRIGYGNLWDTKYHMLPLSISHVSKITNILAKVKSATLVKDLPYFKEEIEGKYYLEFKNSTNSEITRFYTNHPYYHNITIDYDNNDVWWLKELYPEVKIYRIREGILIVFKDNSIRLMHSCEFFSFARTLYHSGIITHHGDLIIEEVPKYFDESEISYRVLNVSIDRYEVGQRSKGEIYKLRNGDIIAKTPFVVVHIEHGNKVIYSDNFYRLRLLPGTSNPFSK